MVSDDFNQNIQSIQLKADTEEYFMYNYKKSRLILLGSAVGDEAQDLMT